jgi:hypothetical protein
VEEVVSSKYVGGVDLDLHVDVGVGAERERVAGSRV